MAKTTTKPRQRRKAPSTSPDIPLSLLAKNNCSTLDVKKEILDAEHYILADGQPSLLSKDPEPGCLVDNGDHELMKMDTSRSSESREVLRDIKVDENVVSPALLPPHEITKKATKSEPRKTKTKRDVRFSSPLVTPSSRHSPPIRAVASVSTTIPASTSTTIKPSLPFSTLFQLPPVSNDQKPLPPSTPTPPPPLPKRPSPPPTRTRTRKTPNTHIYTLLSTIWSTHKRVPTAASRRAWALARNVDPSIVHKWFYRAKARAVKSGDAEFGGGEYVLGVGDAEGDLRKWEEEKGKRLFKKEEEEEEEVKDGVQLTTVPLLTPDRSPSPPSSMSIPATPNDFQHRLPGPHTQSLLIQDRSDHKTAPPLIASDADDDYLMKALPQTIKNEDNDAYMHYQMTHTASYPNDQQQQFNTDIPNLQNTNTNPTPLCHLNFQHAPDETYHEIQDTTLPIDDEYYYYNQLSGIPFLSHWQAQALLDRQFQSQSHELNAPMDGTDTQQESDAYQYPAYFKAYFSESTTGSCTNTSQMHPLTFDASTQSYPSYTFYSGCTNDSDFDLYLAAYSLPEDVGRQMLDTSAGLNREFGLFGSGAGEV